MMRYTFLGFLGVRDAIKLSQVSKTVKYSIDPNSPLFRLTNQLNAQTDDLNEKNVSYLLLLLYNEITKRDSCEADIDLKEF